jgi:nucleotide-binding universal stress UspA family protein
MSYQTILVHVDDTPDVGRRIRLAAALAQRFGAHLVGAAATGVAHQWVPRAAPADSAPALALHLSFLRAQARQALAGFTREAEACGLDAFEARLLDDEAGAGISLLARGADLVVIGQRPPHARRAAGVPDFDDQVLRHSARPVLIVPYTGALARVGTRVLLGWDAGEAAARAMLLALPLLRQAQSVHIAVFEAARPHGAANSLDPRPYLARHGIRAELSIHRHEDERVRRQRHPLGEALLSLATDLSADLLVMGASGHSRLRTSLRGGVTRTVCAAMTIPVLMAH